LAVSSTGVLPAESVMAQPFGITNASVAYGSDSIQPRLYISGIPYDLANMNEVPGN
jgi:hypothetical protein